MAPLCKFWQQGNCRNGASCRFEHPGANSNPFGTPNTNNNNNNNRFNALNTGGNRPQDGPNPYKITKEGIKVDLADERPTWILSCYGPGRDAPEQLFGGYPREQSLEEVMVYIRGSGNQQQAMAEVTALYQQSQQQIETTLGNLDGAVQFLLAAENNHPNRIDICKQNTREGGTIGIFAREPEQGGFAANPLTSHSSANQNAFSSNPQPNPFGGGGGSAFGQPSALGQKPNPFGAAPSSQFGQPSQMGAAASAFGQPSQMGSSGSAFGQPSALGSRPSPFGAPSAGSSSGFGPVGQQSAFGQPSALGQRPNPFGGAPASSAPSPFGQPTAAAAAAPNPFGQPAPSTSSPFGQPASTNPFGQGASASNDLSMDTSAPPPAASNPFGQPSGSGFGAPANNNAFASQPSGFAAAGSSNPFGPPQTQSQPQPQVAATTAKTGPYAPGSTKQHPPAESYITKTMGNGPITSFRGQQVIYKWKVHDKYQDQPPQDRTSKDIPVPGVRNPDGSWRKIFFPDGPPSYNKDTEPDPSKYDATVQAAYATMAATGRFEGDMPEVPPMREECLWNF
ncbi:hypothetical protein F4775DRAFT_575584 [Biscogniauxia sp. FL1348]|nr:hypothetical protein F4775DRAFT_575584 [Biscogniauxia sp. FL1348]